MKKPWKRALLGAGFLFLSQILPASAGDPAVFRFGVCLPLSGEFAQLGRTSLAGIAIRLREANTHTAQTGIRLEMTLRDSGSLPETTRQAIRELADKEGLSAIIGPIMPENIRIAMEEAKRRNLVMISPSSTLNDLGLRGERVFSIMFSNQTQGEALAEFIHKRFGFKRAAVILNSRSVYSRSVYASFRKMFEKGGGRMAAEEEYDCETDQAVDFDFRPFLARVKAAAPNFVLLPDLYEEVAAIISQSAEVGLHTLFCGGDSWAQDLLFLSAGKSLVGSFFVSFYDLNNPIMRRFVTLLDQSDEPDANLASVCGYDALSLLMEAAKRGFSSDGIIAGLYAIRAFPLATGTITIDPHAGILKTAYICEVVERNGNYRQKTIDVIEPIN